MAMKDILSVKEIMEMFGVSRKKAQALYDARNAD